MKTDVIFIIISLAIAGIIAAFTFTNRKSNPGEVVILYDGQIIKTCSLADNTDISIDEEGYNKVRIQDGQVWMMEADCPDKICINTGKCSASGSIICCLPHKLIVEIRKKDDAVDGLSF